MVEKKKRKVFFWKIQIRKEKKMKIAQFGFNDQEKKNVLLVLGSFATMASEQLGKKKGEKKLIHCQLDHNFLVYLDFRSIFFL
jgi:hypothetical protein